MHTLEPRNVHPVLWALREIVGLPDREIMRRARVKKADLRRLEGQYLLDPARMVRVHQLLKDAANEIARAASLRIEPAPRKAEGAQRHWYRALELQQYRDAAHKTVGWILTQFRPAPPGYRPPRETNLSNDLLRTIGRSGVPRARALSYLKQLHSHTSIQRCADRIGVREIRRDGQRWWLPPDDVQPLSKSQPHAPPPMKLADPTHAPKAFRVQTLLQTYLVKRPDGALARDAVDFVREKTQCSRTQVMRAARDLRVLRETRGFGPGKATTWRLQQAVDAIHAQRRLKLVDPPHDDDR